MKTPFKESRAVFLALGIILLITVPLLIFFASEDDADEKILSEFRIFPFDDDRSVEELKNDAEFINSSFLLFGFQKEPVLLGFDLEFEEDKRYVLELKNPNFREVLLYRKDSEGQYNLIDKAGTVVGKGNALAYPNPSFELGQHHEYANEFLLQISSVEPINFTMSVHGKQHFLDQYSKILFFVSLYIGLIVALFLYNLILYFMVRDKVYLLYSFYIFFISLAQINLLGFTFHYLFKDNVQIYENSIIGFSAIAGVFGIFFLRYFLKTKYYTPFIDKLLKVNIGLYLISFAFRLLSLIEVSYVLTDISGLMIAALFIISSSIIARKGVRSAIYFLGAFLMFFFGLVIYILQNRGIIELGTYANFPILLGSALEAILLSLALADRINILKKEKEQEQHDRLEAIKENERLIREQNAILEEKVQTRTHELEVTLRNLQNTQTQLVNQEKMASLGQLTAGVAHEINNPINFVSSNINPLKRDISDVIEIMDAYKQMGIKEFSPETLKQLNNLEKEIDLDYVRDEIDQLLQGMEDGAKRTVEIVKGLKLFSRVDEQDVKKVDLHAGISSTLVLLNSSMSNKIKIIKDFGEVPMVDCLAGKINQVFMNIVNNAVHALTENLEVNPNPVIVIKTSTEGEYAKIEIIDNGPGIPDHVKERIFEPFFTTKAVGKGTGLGLSIVYSIIEKHHGTLDVESVPDAGTSFIIKLPITQKTSMI
jgi:two-component system, NtrC family, sensor kinase